MTPYDTAALCILAALALFLLAGVIGIHIRALSRRAEIAGIRPASCQCGGGDVEKAS
jgi:hypothetical protein